MKRILIVDDVPERITDIQQEVVFSFPPDHFRVQGAGNVQEAMQAFDQCNEGFDLVVLDMRLPEDPFVPEDERETAGIYLFKRFAAEFPGTKFVLSSGSHSRNDCPEVPMPPNFPAENFWCVPKTADREALLQILNGL